MLTDSEVYEKRAICVTRLQSNTFSDERDTRSCSHEAKQRSTMELWTRVHTRFFLPRLLKPKIR